MSHVADRILTQVVRHGPWVMKWVTIEFWFLRVISEVRFSYFFTWNELSSLTANAIFKLGINQIAKFEANLYSCTVVMYLMNYLLIIERKCRTQWIDALQKALKASSTFTKFSIWIATPLKNHDEISSLFRDSNLLFEVSYDAQMICRPSCLISSRTKSKSLPLSSSSSSSLYAAPFYDIL